MLQTSHQTGAHVVSVLPDYNLSGRGLSPALMAQYLRETTGSVAAARCFALAMHEQAAWANDSWGAFWAGVAALT